MGRRGRSRRGFERGYGPSGDSSEGKEDPRSELSTTLCTPRTWRADSEKVGCGTAFPSSYILHQLLSSPSQAEATPTTIHLQDYNLLVLQLVTLPNLILATLPHLPADILNGADESTDLDLTIPGHLSITPAIKDALKKLLTDHSIALEFTYGHWGGLADELKGREAYDLVLTAETIYAEESVDDLVAVLRSASSSSAIAVSKLNIGLSGGEGEKLEETFGDMSVKENWAKEISQGERVVLVAAKVSSIGSSSHTTQHLSYFTSRRVTSRWVAFVQCPT